MNSRISWVVALVLGSLASVTAVGLVWGRLGKTGAAGSDQQPAQFAPIRHGSSDPASAIAARAPKSSAADTPDPAAGKPDVTLSREEREYLWQVEHHGLVLSRYGFSRLAQALRRNDPAELEALLADRFEGRVPESPRETRLETGALRVLRQQDSGLPPLKLKGFDFVARLFEDRKRFTRSPQVKFALMALAPQDRHRLDGPWEGTCQLRMWGEMGPSRPGEVLLYLRYRLPRPTESLLKGTGWLQSCSITQRQVSEAPQFLMREVASERGIRTENLHDNWKKGTKLESVSGGVYLCDYNRDGWLDMLLVDLSGNALYEGRPGGKMVDVTTKVKLPQTPQPAGAAIVDVDNDGWEDLILGSVLLRNEEGQAFRARGSVPGLGLSMNSSAIIADYDRDGLIDLFVTSLGQTKTASWIGGEGRSISGNALWHNDGDWHFTNVTDKSRATGGDRSTFSALWLDADEDGWPDLYVINEFGSGVLLVNGGDGTFREQSVEDAPGDFGSMGVSCGDYDNDGHIDLYVANMYSKAGNRVIGNLWPGTYPDAILAKLRSLTMGSQIHRNLGGLKFDRVGRRLQVADVGWSYGPAMIDLNNDGWLDLYATCGFMSQSRDDPDG
jgi:hypothetical protein